MKSKFKIIFNDIDALIARDPATSSRIEAILCSAGLQAIVAYRANHWLWEKGFKLTARILSQIARFLTGVEIHPAARIGKSFCIRLMFEVMKSESTYRILYSRLHVKK